MTSSSCRAGDTACDEASTTVPIVASTPAPLNTLRVVLATVRAVAILLRWEERAG